jgi:hypothetical protein
MTPAATDAVRSRVIKERVQEWRRDPRINRVYYNCPVEGQQAWFGVDGKRVYPDVVVSLKDGRWIVEDVETLESIGEAETIKWHTFTKIRADEVHLLVPERAYRTARTVTDGIRDLDLCTYIVVNDVVLFQT